MGNSPLVFLVATNNQLVNEVRNNLTAKGCDVVYINSLGAFLSNLLIKKKAPLFRGYLIFLMSSFFNDNLRTTRYVLDKFYFLLWAKLVNKMGLRSVFIFPYTNSNSMSKRIDKLISKLVITTDTSATVVFAGNFGELPLNSLLKSKTFQKDRLRLWQKVERSPNNFKFFPTEPTALAEKITDVLFSLKYRGMRVALLGQAIKNSSLKSYLSKSSLQVQKKRTSIQAEQLHTGVDESFVITEDKLTPSKILSQVTPLSNSQFLKFQTKNKVYIKVSVAFLLFFLILPVWLFLTAAFFVVQADSLLNVGKFTEATLVTRASAPLLKTLHTTGGFLGGVLNTDLYNSILTLEQTNTVIVKKINIITGLNSLYSELKSSSSTTKPNIYTAIESNLKGLHNDLNLLEATAINSHLLYIFPKGPWRVARLEQEKDLVTNLIALANFLPNILGDAGQIKYLVIFEDPNSPRPSGGKAKSAWAVILDGGEIASVEGLDLTRGHNNLVGSLPVPQSYQSVLGENWSLENYNLFPHYEESARKALYFADKQFGFRADAVISINSEDIEDNINGFTDDRFVYKNLSLLAKHLLDHKIRLYFSDPKINNSFQSLIIPEEQALAGCLTCNIDHLSYFEVSGDDPRYLLRQGNLNISIEQGVVKHNLKISFVNSSDKSHKTLMGFLVNEDAGFSPPIILSDRESRTPSYEAVGIKGHKLVLVELVVAPAERRVVELVWEDGFVFQHNNLQKHIFLWGPSASRPLDLQINITVPKEKLYAFDPELILTRHGVLSYNTDLSQASSKRIYLK